MSGWSGRDRDADDFSPTSACAASTTGIKFCNAGSTELINPEAAPSTDAKAHIALWRGRLKSGMQASLDPSTIYLPLRGDIGRLQDGADGQR